MIGLVNGLVRRPWLVAAVAVMLLAVPVVVADASTSSRSVAPAGPPPIAWQPCPEAADAQCGTVSVPVDWDRPHGARIALALARRAATDPSARVGSLLLNPGGPGISGRDEVLFRSGRFSEELRRRFDLVGFDPRGVGRSHPVLCSSALVRGAPSLVLSGQADFDAWLVYNRRLREDCRVRTGPLYDHVDTLSVVRDLDLMRAALGEPQLTFYGVSGGSLIAQQYAERFPRRARAIVADSFLDHSIDAAAALAFGAATTQDSFNEFVAWNARTPTSPLYGRDARSVWRRVLARTDRGEIPHPEDPAKVLLPEELIGFAQGMFGAPMWPLLATVLAAWDAGEPFPFPPGDPEPEVIPYPVPAIMCSDFSAPVRDYTRYARHVRRARSVAPDMRFSPGATYVLLACLGSPEPIPNPEHPLRVRGLATPLLIVNALHDPATSYEWAVRGARQLGDQGVLLTYEGWGHVTYGHGSCVDGAVDAYLITLTVPAAGTRCPAVEAASSATAGTGRPAFR